MTPENAITNYQDKVTLVTARLHDLADKVSRVAEPHRPELGDIAWTEHAVDVVDEIYSTIHDLRLGVLITRAAQVDTAQREQEAR